MEEIQHGVIVRPIEERDERDFVRGISSGIAPVVNNAARDWSKFLPTFEGQKYLFDCNNCTGFSFANTFETQMNWLKSTGALSGSTLEWFEDNGYFDENGSFAISERFAGIMAGTTINGNSPFLVWKAAAKYGILPRKDLSYNVTQSAQFSSQASMCVDYYRKSAVSPAMLQKAAKALILLTIQYEWIGGEFNAETPVSGLLEALEQSPLQIAVPVCLPDWNFSYVNVCGIHEADHAITLYGEGADGKWNIYDQYHPEIKLLDKNYFIPQAILAVITPCPPEPVIPAQQENEPPSALEISWAEKVLKWISGKLASLNNATAVPAYSFWDEIIETV